MGVEAATVGQGAAPSRERSPGWEASGPVDGPVIVFVHGAVASRRLWSPQIARLSDRYRCVTFDLPGHGSLADHAFQLDEAVDRVRSVIDEAAGGRATVVGLSLGGYTAIALAARHPERVRGLVVAGASLDATGISRLGFAAYGWLLSLIPERLARWLLVRVVFRRRDPIEAAGIAEDYQLRRGGAAVRSIIGVPFRRLLAAYGGPILVINGDLDVAMVAGEARFVRGVPGVQRIRLRRATHVSNVDRPDEFAAAIAAFEAGLAP